MFNTLTVLLTMVLLIVVHNECYVGARIHTAKDTVRSYRDFLQHKSYTLSKQPIFDGDGLEVQIQIPVTISLPPMNINEKDLERLFGGGISETLKKIILKKLLNKFSGKILDNETPNLNDLSQPDNNAYVNDEYLPIDKDITVKSYRNNIPEAGRPLEEALEDRPLNYSRHKREAPSGGAMSKKEVKANKLLANGASKDDWGIQEGESNMNSKVVLPDGPKPLMNSNNRVSEIVIEKFDTRKFSDDDPLKHFLGHRFSSLFQSRPTRDSLYNSYPPTSFDDLELGTGMALEFSQGLEIEKRLGKLDSIFSALRLDSEECRKKVTCEVSREATKYFPLAEIIRQETKLNANLRERGRELLESSDGKRLLGYIEANTRGKDRYRQCDVYRFSCRKDVSQMIDMDALVVWKEVVGWLTVKVLANGR